MKKVLSICSLMCLFSGVTTAAATPGYFDFGDGFNLPDADKVCRQLPTGGEYVGRCDRSGTECTKSHPDNPKYAWCYPVLDNPQIKATCAATCCQNGQYVWYTLGKNRQCESLNGGYGRFQGICKKWEYLVDYCKNGDGKESCGSCADDEECQPRTFKQTADHEGGKHNGIGCDAVSECHCVKVRETIVPEEEHKCPDDMEWNSDKSECVCKDKNKIKQGDKCIVKPEEEVEEECYWENDLQINCDCGVTLTEHQHFPVTKKFLKEMYISSCDELKQEFRAAHASDQDMKIALNTPSSTFAGDRMTYALEMRKKICELACPSVKTSSGAEQRLMVVAYNPSATSTETGPSKAEIDSAKSVLDAAFSGEGSVWKDKEGKFNKARLASDLTAGVVLGTVGGVVSGVVIKKKQIEKGFEALHCTVGGQKVADWGDEFMVGFRR